VKLSELISALVDVKNAHGDLGVFAGDMDEVAFSVVNATDTERYGEKYLYFEGR